MPQVTRIDHVWFSECPGGDRMSEMRGYLPLVNLEGLAFHGLEPEHLDTVRIRVNGMVCLEIGPGFDEDYQPITGGQAMMIMWDMARKPLTGSRIGLQLGMDLRKAKAAEIMVRTARGAPSVVKLRVDCFVPMVFA